MFYYPSRTRRPKMKWNSVPSLLPLPCLNLFHKFLLSLFNIYFLNRLGGFFLFQ